MSIQFLNSENLLVDEMADWLEKAARCSCAGAKTLDHILVVVPTRQSGRRLRLALAQRLGACVPPRILLPARLLATAEGAEPVEATEAERIGALASLLGTLDLSSYAKLFPGRGAAADRSFSWRLGIATQLDDVWRTLGENALTMADVAALVESDPNVLPLSEEVERWKQLAAVEALLFAKLGELGRCHPAEARKRGVAQPAIPEGVTELVLPALVDAQPAFFKAMDQAVQQNPDLTVTVLLHATKDDRDRFDAWGRPNPDAWTADHAPAIPLREGQYILTANSVQQAEAAADLIERVQDHEELPGIGLADEDLFPELQSALLARGKRVHNPSAMPLLHSSLGHMVAQVSQLLTRPTYAVFAAWLRESDTQRYFEHAFRKKPAFSFLGVLRALDKLHKEHLPQTFQDVRTYCSLKDDWWPLRDVVDVVKEWLDPKGRARADHLRALLGEIFSARLLHEQKAGDRELLAAAEALNEAVAAADCDLVRRVLPDDAERALLFEALLGSAAYSLEPDDPACMLTDGWLELAWNPAAELIICGFNEESVPESVVGHAFVPDSLRKALGLTHNEQRTARDTYLFRSLLLSREPGAVTVLLERMNARGDVRKPSRLLFLCGDDDATFAARAIRLYQDSEKPASGHARSLPDAWRLRLPVPLPPAARALPAGWPTVAIPERLSVTAFKDYLACPFTFFLKHILRLKEADDRDRELDAMAFGTLCHSVLEAFGKEACTCRNSCDADEIAAFLQGELERLMHERFGPQRPTVLRLQEESLRQRLAFFSKKQAQEARDGWRILKPEVEASITLHGLTVKGKIDRIDLHAEKGCRILDYKTWSKAKGSDGFCSSSKKDVERAATCGWGSFMIDGKPAVWTDLQLPLYRRLVASLGDIIPAGTCKFECGYFVVGDTEMDTGCETWDFDPMRESSDAAIRYVIERVQAGLFWPSVELAEEFEPLFPIEPEEGVASEWVADQETRLERLPPAVPVPPPDSEPEPAPKTAKGKGKKA